jgi:transcriptional regulator with XRE-family HTH domain
MARESTTKIRFVFASNVRRIRTARGMSQEKLAEECGLHRTYISDIERAERNLSIENMERIAQALAVDVRELLATEGMKSDHEATSTP